MANPLGSTPGIIVGVGVGTAAAAALEPAIELPKQDAWSRNPNRILEPATLARLVAQGGVDLTVAHAEALREGYAADKVDALVYLSQAVPGFAEALALWRRNPGDFDALWSHALVKAGLDARYMPFLNQLKDDRLSPPVVALAIVRGILKDPGFLPVGPPATEGKVKAFPVSALDALTEAAAFGFDSDRLFVETAISGRPMGPESAAAAVFRAILERVDFDRAISEGDIRNEWADAIFETARQILTANQYAELNLRGWIDKPTMYAGTAKHGMSQADSDLLFEVLGRPIPVHQVTTGLARGGTYNGPVAGIPEAYIRSLQEGNQRPEWYNLSYANRYSLPSAFVLRALATAGDVTQAEANTLLLQIGWPPDLAETVSTRWAGGSGGSTKELTKAEAATAYEAGQLTEEQYRTVLAALGYSGSAQDQEVALSDARVINTERARVVTALHKLYTTHAVDETATRADLATAGMHQAAIDRVLPLWTLERDATVKQLTAAQVRAAYRKNLISQPTALAELEERGYSVADAGEYLAS